MNKVNNFEVKNIDLAEMNEIVEIKDDELKQITGGDYTEYTAVRGSCEHAH
ncbi:MAG: bacteriocin-like protein [Bermanella sp.]|jgi:bacteriocin-like protein